MVSTNYTRYIDILDTKPRCGFQWIAWIDMIVIGYQMHYLYKFMVFR